MNHYNILVHIIIFVVIILSFYLIINNCTYSNISLYSKNNFDNNKSETLKQYFSQLETKINSIENNKNNNTLQ